MQLQIDRRANRTVVLCTGDLDVSGALELVSGVKPLESEGKTPIVLDLAAVPKLTDARVQTLRQMFEAAGERQALLAWDGPPLLRLANVPPGVQEVLDTSGFRERLAGWAGDSFETSPMTSYRKLLPRIRDAFPAPVSDALHDAYLVASVARALDRVDEFKNEHPYLGVPLKLDYERARAAKIPDRMTSLETVIAEVGDYLQGHVIWGHPHTQEQVIPPPTIASVLGQMFGAIYNPNLLWDAYSHRVA